MSDDESKKDCDDTACDGDCLRCRGVSEQELVEATLEAARRAEAMHKLASENGYTTRDLLNMFSIAVKGAIQSCPDEEAAKDAQALLTAWASLSLELMVFVVTAAKYREQSTN